MKKKFTYVLATLVLALVAGGAMAQKGVTTAPDYSAILDLRNPANKGLLIPQVALTSATLKAPVPVTPAGTGPLQDGLLVYNTSTSTANGLSGKGYYYWDNTAAKWTLLQTAPAWLTTGNAGTSSGTNFLGTTDLKPLRIRTNNLERMVVDSLGNVGIGLKNIAALAPNYAPKVRFQVDNSVLFGSDTAGTDNQFYWSYSRGSLAAGKQDTASGANSIALGLQNKAGGANAIALGNNNALNATGANGNFALGYKQTISGAANIATVIGANNAITGNNANMAVGFNQTISTIDSSFTIGNGNTITGAAVTNMRNSFAFGYSNKIITTAASSMGNYAFGANHYINTSGTAATSNAVTIGNADTIMSGTLTSANNMAIGYTNKITSGSTTGSYVFGYNNRISSTSAASTIIGSSNVSNSIFANNTNYIFGVNNSITGSTNNSVVVGSNATITGPTTGSPISALLISAADGGIDDGTLRNKISATGSILVSTGNSNIVGANNGAIFSTTDSNTVTTTNGLILATGSNNNVISGGSNTNPSFILSTSAKPDTINTTAGGFIISASAGSTVIPDGHNYAMVINASASPGSFSSHGPGSFSTYIDSGYYFFLGNKENPTDFSSLSMTLGGDRTDPDYATLRIRSNNEEGIGSLRVEGGATIKGINAATGNGLDVTNGIVTGGGITASGDITTAGGITAVGDISTDGDFYSMGMLVTSDRRLKKEITTLPSVLKKLQQLRGVSYYWSDTDRARRMPGRQIGMIAQELEAVYPELVQTNPRTGYKNVNYAQFTGVLLQGIKEQQEQIEAHQKQIDDKQAQIDAVQEKMDEIKKQVAEIKAAMSRKK